MDALMLRTAEASDLAQLAALERAAFEMDRLSRRALQYSLTAATRRVLVITCGSRLLASVVVCVRRDSRHLRIYSLAVDEAARGLGLGSIKPAMRRRRSPRPFRSAVPAPMTSK
jgi:ribosomal protein S18 acetylase RimI-like enzyme